MSIANAIKSSVVKSVIGSAIWEGTKIYRGLDNELLTADKVLTAVMGNFDFVETGYLQGVEQKQWMDVVLEAHRNNNPDKVIDLWKEICNIEKEHSSYSTWGKLIIATLYTPKKKDKVDTGPFLHIDKELAGVHLYANERTALVAFKKRLSELKHVGSQNHSTRLIDEIFTILRRKPGIQKEALKFAFEESFIDHLNELEDPKLRTLAVREKLDQILVINLKSKLGSVEMVNKMKSMHNHPNRDVVDPKAKIVDMADLGRKLGILGGVNPLSLLTGGARGLIRGEYNQNYAPMDNLNQAFSGNTFPYQFPQTPASHFTGCGNPNCANCGSDNPEPAIAAKEQAIGMLVDTWMALAGEGLGSDVFTPDIKERLRDMLVENAKEKFNSVPKSTTVSLATVIKLKNAMIGCRWDNNFLEISYINQPMGIQPAIFSASIDVVGAKEIFNNIEDILASEYPVRQLELLVHSLSGNTVHNY